MSNVLKVSLQTTIPATLIWWYLFYSRERRKIVARRRILARGMVRQILSAAERRDYRASHRWTDGLASSGLLWSGIHSTRVETAVLFRDLDLGSSEALACRPGMIR